MIMDDFSLWSPEEIERTKDTYRMPAKEDLRQLHVEIHEKLESEKDRKKRWLLIEEVYRLRTAALTEGLLKEEAL